MNINRKYIIIFGTLILLLVITTGAITYYKEKAIQTQIPTGKPSVLSFSQDYPINPEESSAFIDYCKNAALYSDIFSDTEELKNTKIKEVVCILNKILPEDIDSYTVSSDIVSSDKPYLSSFYALSSVSSFKTDRYIGISIDLKDAVREYDQSLLEEEKLYFCSISEPAWEDLFYLQIAPEQNLFLLEGNTGCTGLIMNKTPSITFSGFIPNSDLLNIKLYLVDEQTVSNVMSNQSFSEIKEILSNYPIIWQMEKPIIP